MQLTNLLFGLKELPIYIFFNSTYRNSSVTFFPLSGQMLLKRIKHIKILVHSKRVKYYSSTSSADMSKNFRKKDV